MMIEKLKRIFKKLRFVFLGSVLTLSVLAFFPAPLEGNWHCHLMGCMGGGHQFMCFENGKVLFVSEHEPSPTWIGNYEKLGWGRYKVEIFYDGETIARPSILFLWPHRFFGGVTWRDVSFTKSARVLEEPAQQWMNEFVSTNVLLREIEGETKYFFNGKECPLSLIEKVLRGYCDSGHFEEEPLILYVTDKGVPPELQTILSSLSLEYETKSNHLLRRGR